MPKLKKRFVCRECGFVSPKWMGRCTECGAWNSLEEEIEAPVKKSAKSPEHGSYSRPKRIAEIDFTEEDRTPTGDSELDRVLGGGIVPGAMILLGGDPGIGKSTLLLQSVESLGRSGQKVLYVSGEESEKQLKMRADRMNVKNKNILFMSEINVPYILDTILAERPQLVIIDSIQTMYAPDIQSAPGSVTQIRDNAASLLQMAKKENISVVLVGHVTKDGSLAGPRVLEHMVDTVLYFEGDRFHSYRVLRAVKNRFGSTNEIGIFEMAPTGLLPVKNPSEAMLKSRPENTCGSVVVPVMEGTRPLLIEMQGLMASTSYGNPRRMAKGMDYNRMVLLLAVMEKRLGIMLQDQDAYVNIVGGVKADEPALDLGAVTALYSSFRNFEVPGDMIVFGEVGLTGEVRSVQYAENRLIEAARLGFKKCILPKGSINPKKLDKNTLEQIRNIELFPVENIAQALGILDHSRS
ncbi:MAG: DNA repair protein RadA [Eubacteriaceae bacterium]